MMHAYDELYLEPARESLGNMLHFAVYDLKTGIEEFYGMFLNTGIGARFGRGEAGLTVGMSGIELAYEVLFKVTGTYCNVKPSFYTDKSPEYWCGWALAYYEWDRNIPFERINEVIGIKEILDMYDPFHEADIRKFVDEMDHRMSMHSEVSRLARLRRYADLTQKKLAEKSGVSARMIEQYEQGKKSLKRASAETVYSLSKALNCKIEDLML